MKKQIRLRYILYIICIFLGMLIFSNKVFATGKMVLVTNKIQIQKGENASDSDSNLMVMRLNQEGVNPNFSEDIKEYYLIIDNSIDRLDVTALPKNAGAKVTVSGNENLKDGLNIINIHVESKDKTQTSDYKIYVTKTSNKEAANADLETLAIRETFPLPAFDANVTHYDVEVSNETGSVYVLAIPQKTNASVKIEGNDNLKIGNNLVTVTVTAENNITTKKYQINVYRRNEEEEKKTDEGEKSQAEKLSVLFDENNDNNDNNDEEVETNEEQEELNRKEENSNKIKAIFFVIVFAVILIIICFYDRIRL